MLNDLIRHCTEFVTPDSFFMGERLPAGFALPDNILLFAHDWFPPKSFEHSRYMLILPAIPLIYTVDEDSDFQLSPGQVMFSHPCQKRVLRKTHPDLEHGYLRLMITFDLAAPQYYLPEGDVLDVTPYAETCLADMVRALAEEHPVDLSLALFRFLREISAHRAVSQPKTLSRIVKRAIGYVNNNSGRGSSLEKIAADTGTSVSNLRWLFRKEMGESIGSFVKHHRQKVAEYNLQMTSLRIDEIAALCGFESVYSFSHFFRKHAGMPPSAFRKAHKKTQAEPIGRKAAARRESTESAWDTPAETPADSGSAN